MMEMLKEIFWAAFAALGAIVIFFSNRAGKQDEENKQLKKQQDEVVQALGIDDRYKRDAKYRDSVQDRFNG